jgi:predicted dehydrogenase
MLRGAISGFGEVAAQAHLPGWAVCRDLQIVAIHDPVAARRHAAINLIRHVRVYDDLELMLDGEKLDFVDIASPPAYHGATAARALEAGAHVLIEKPLCLDSNTFAALRRAAADASRVLMCVHNWKHAPAYRRAHQLIAAGRLGEVTHLAFDRLRNGPAGQGGSALGTAERWRLDAGMGGGILIDHGWHVFYLMQWLIGGGAPRAVAAELGYRPGSNVDDFARLRVDFASATADARLSWRAPQRVTTARIEGTGGVLTVDGDRLELRKADGLAEMWEVGDHADDSYHAGWFAGMAANFLAAIAQGPNGSLMAENIAEARSAIALLGAARRSAQGGGAPVDLGR